MKKDFSISLLLDFYKNLLTEKQVSALDMYYNMDLSLSEISESVGVTRQGVRNFIKKGEEKLVAIEEALGLAKKTEEINTLLDDISREAENKGLQNISEKVTHITEILES